MIKCPKCGSEYDGAEKFCPKDGTRLDDEEFLVSENKKKNSDPLIDTVIQGRYKVLGKLGEGGMGVVYVAEHVEIEKKVALKVLRDDFTKRPEVVARFRQEAKSASKIGNAHIVDVTDFGQLDSGGVFFVMEHLKGKGLSDVIRNEVIDERRAVNIVLQIARALKAAHKLGIVHRDLKPENIFLVQNDEQTDFVKILDFGIAKISDRDSEGQRLTKTGMIFGTPEYMSPEQAAGKPLDHRVDIYALGCIMFEMFTGEVPYEGESFMAVLTQHMFEPIPRIEILNPKTDVRQSVRDVVYKAMAKEKDERYQDMEALAKDLERAIDGSWEFPTIGSNSVTRSAGYSLGGLGKRRNFKKMVFPMSIIVGLVVVVAVAYLLGYIPGRHSGNEISVAAAKNIEKSESNKTTSVVKKDEMDKGRIEEKETEIDTEKRDSEKDTDESKEKEEETIIAVEIHADPRNAVIFVEGMGQVCSSTPCEVSMEIGIPKRITAKKEDRSSEIVITPSKQNREVSLKIEKKEKRIIRVKNKEKKKKDGKAKGSGGLKIPDIFRNN